MIRLIGEAAEEQLDRTAPGSILKFVERRRETPRHRCFLVLFRKTSEMVPGTILMTPVVDTGFDLFERHSRPRQC